MKASRKKIQHHLGNYRGLIMSKVNVNSFIEYLMAEKLESHGGDDCCGEDCCGEEVITEWTLTEDEVPEDGETVLAFFCQFNDEGDMLPDSRRVIVKFNQNPVEGGDDKWVTETNDRFDGTSRLVAPLMWIHLPDMPTIKVEVNSKMTVFLV